MNKFIKKYDLAKKLKHLVIILCINWILAFAYCAIFSSLSPTSLSSTLAVIGFLYILIGGATYLGGMHAVSNYTENFSITQAQRLQDSKDRNAFNILMFIYGISTLLVSYLIFLLDR